MHEGLTVFTSVSPSYKYSSELALCLKLFRKALPENSRLLFSENMLPCSLRALIKENLSSLSPYVLIAKEPAMLLGKNTVKTLTGILDTNPETACVLPSDIRGYRTGKAAGYYTLRGFERFSDSLFDEAIPTSPYDGRDPWMFLIRRSALSEIEVPENPLDIPKMLGPRGTCISLNTYIHPFIDYYNETREEVIDLVPVSTRCVLDIGCARGNFGASVKKKLDCRVAGIEINTYEAQEARSKLDLVIEGDLLTADITEKFDCITCLDALEHVGDSGAFLEKIRTLLNSNGHLLLSIPNVGHWSIIEDLIAGRWDYVPAGILCITHVRFFTKKTIESLLRDAGFMITALKENTTAPPENENNFLGLLDRSGLEVDRKSLSCLGYYIVAQKIARLQERE